MRKLYLQCECGQRMRVPRSAIGKRGICPNCGRAITINAGSTGSSNVSESQRPQFTSTTDPTWKTQTIPPPEDARRAFGRAADLFCEGRYGEALSIFDALAQQFPGSIEIRNAREQCMSARRRTPAALEGPREHTIPAADHDPGRLKRIVFDKLVEKMQFGATDEVQLQAAKLVGQLLGMFENGRAANAKPDQEAGISKHDSQPEPEAAQDHPGDDAASPSDPENGIDGKTAPSEELDFEQDSIRVSDRRARSKTGRLEGERAVGHDA